jgi:hypothetical protein
MKAAAAVFVIFVTMAFPYYYNSGLCQLIIFNEEKLYILYCVNPTSVPTGHQR